MDWKEYGGGGSEIDPDCAQAPFEVNTSMIKLTKKCLIPIVISALAPSALAQSLDNTFDTALGTAGLTTKSARFDQQLLPFFQSKSHPALLYEAAHSDPWRAPFMIETMRDQLAQPSDRIHDELAVGARMLGINIRRSLLADTAATTAQFADRPGALSATLQRMQKEGLIIGAVPNSAALPEPVKQAAALLLTTMMDAAPLRRAAFNRVPNVDSLYVRARTPESDKYDADRVVKTMRDIEDFDIRFIIAGSQDVAASAVAAKLKLLGVDRSEKFNFKISTTWGDVVLSGGADNRYENSSALLIIDTSGDDTYVGLPCNRSFTNWASIVIDVRGNDKYVSNPELVNRAVKSEPNRRNPSGFGPASAALGVAMIFDVMGDDLYRTTAPGIGSATMGVASISDTSGNDIYDCYQNGIGYGNFGLGLVEDIAGNDRYNGFANCQGHGAPMGFGGVIDRGGDDVYVAENTVLDFPSPQSAQANASLSQGAGVGRRADYLDGHSLSGGIGVLYDLDGNDSYSCGVFGQGVGYWDGLGCLFDRAGDDKYNGIWYVQGASAHFGIGYLEDESGTDDYRATTNMAMGAGHDFGLGFLLDRSGNDTYTAPNLSLGASSSNGIGVFMDFIGDDKYEGSNITLGRAAEVTSGSLRDRCLSLGLFYDGGGNDAYPIATNWARNAARLVNWTDRGASPEESQFGIFWDR